MLKQLVKIKISVSYIFKEKVKLPQTAIAKVSGGQMPQFFWTNQLHAIFGPQYALPSNGFIADRTHGR